MNGLHNNHIIMYNNNTNNYYINLKILQSNIYI